MKKIFTLIAVLASITTFAAPAPDPRDAKISISNNDRAMMQVKIDGRMYNVNNSFVLDNIRTGNHTISIYKTDNAGFRKKTQVIYNTSMFVSPAQTINININRNDRVVVNTTTDRFNRDDHRGNDNHYNDHDNHDNRNNNNNYGRH
jgi:hypothetical protein